MTQIITRFAPSPTGYLHIGNARTALINWLYTRKYKGRFILRFDDTDPERSKEEYKTAIESDLNWLGLDRDITFNQSERLERYAEVKEQLLQQGRLYPCFETQEELEIKRKLQLSNNKPPIYDRAGLSLSKSQLDTYINQGRKPHYRFLIKDEVITWQDMVKGSVKYQGSNLSDPIVIREDGSMTYMLCSVIDDIDYHISHIIRGEDHVSNTAIHTQMFEAVSGNKNSVPTFGHLSLIKTKDDKISKRTGGFSLKSLREEQGLEAMTINSFLSFIGSAKPVTANKDLSDLVNEFDISSFSKSPTTYMPEELQQLNHKTLMLLDFLEVKNRLAEAGIDGVSEQLWLTVRPNLHRFREIRDWLQICDKQQFDKFRSSANIKMEDSDKEFLKTAAQLLPNEDITGQTWKKWVDLITAKSGKKGKELFILLRLALTNLEHGPELKNVLPLLDKEEIVRRLSNF